MKVYDGWASRYQQERLAERVYETSQMALWMLSYFGGNKKHTLLDTGFGTGSMSICTEGGEVSVIDAIDLSAGMLVGASNKSCYRILMLLDVNSRLLLPHNEYD